MTRPDDAEPIPLSQSMAGGPEFGTGYARGSRLADASSAGLPGIIVAIVLVPFVWLGSRAVRAVRRR